MPAHHYHPVLVHFPIVLPWIVLFGLLYFPSGELVRERFADRFLFLVSLLNLVAVVLAFYSGQWTGDEVVSSLNGPEMSSLGWHQFVGRLNFFGATLLAVLVYVQIEATIRRASLRKVVVVVALLLAVLSVVSGYTGGVLVHSHGVNSKL